MDWLCYSPNRPDILWKGIMGKSQRSSNNMPHDQRRKKISNKTFHRKLLSSQDCSLLWGVVTIYKALGIAFDSYWFYIYSASTVLQAFCQTLGIHLITWLPPQHWDMGDRTRLAWFKHLVQGQRGSRSWSLGWNWSVRGRQIWVLLQLAMWPWTSYVLTFETWCPHYKREL